MEPDPDDEPHEVPPPRSMSMDKAVELFADKVGAKKL
jgi:hypothetical protein